MSKTFVLPRHRLFAPRRRVRAVDGVSFAVAAGHSFALVGESGSGKTTVSQLVLGIERPTAGTIRFEGRPVTTGPRGPEARRFRAAVQAVLQNPYDALSPRLRIGAIVGEPMAALGDLDAARRAERVGDLLARVGLPRDAADRYPHEFSGGQRQRIAIARAISVEPRLLVLDEPVSALDVSIRAQVLGLLRDLRAQTGMGFLFITHDLALVPVLAESVGVMYFGRIVETGPVHEVLRRPLHPYTRRLVAASDPDSPLPASASVSELPDPFAPPRGCAFAGRCPVVRPVCRERRPELTRIDTSVQVACHVVAGG